MRRASWRSRRTSRAARTRRGPWPCTSGRWSARTCTPSIAHASSMSCWRPSPGRWCGRGAIVLGSIDWALGALARTQERYEQAERHFAAAAEIDERLGAPLLLARTRAGWARTLVARGRPEDRDRAQQMLEAGRGHRWAPGSASHRPGSRQVSRRPRCDQRIARHRVERRLSLTSSRFWHESRSVVPNEGPTPIAPVFVTPRFRSAFRSVGLGRSIALK